MTLVKYILVLLLFTIEYPTIGLSYEYTTVNSRVGDDVTLPCKNVIYPDCSSSTWLYSSSRVTTSLELVTSGKIRDSRSNGKLRLGPTCSLQIHNVSSEDAGSYACQQYINGQKHEPDAIVYLSVITVVPSTNLMSGSSVTLHCVLHTHFGPGQCDNHPFNTVTLRWVSDTGTDLQSDPRYQIHTSSCSSTLTTQLQGTDNDRKWTCQLTDEGDEKISQSYTTTFSGSFVTSKPEGVHSTPVTAGIISGVAVFGVLCVVVVVMVMLRRRAGTENETNPEKDFIQQTPDSVTYADINHPKSQCTEKEKPGHDSFVEYATIRTN